MRLTVALAVILTISVTVQDQTEDQKKDLLLNNAKRRIIKRDAAVIIEEFPLDFARDRKQKIVYRRITKQRYRSPKVKYRPPAKYGQSPPKQPPLRHAPPYKLASPKPKYGPTSHSKKINREHGKNTVEYVKRVPTNFKKRQPNKKGPKSSKNNIKSKYVPALLNTQYSFGHQEPAGFGEPPSDVSQPTHGPPVDSYGAPLNPSLAEIYPTAQGAFETSSYYDNIHSNLEQQSKSYRQSWQTDTPNPIVDNNYAPSKKTPAIALPKPSSFSDLGSLFNENYNLDSYSDVFKYNSGKAIGNPVRKGRPTYLSDKIINNAWKSANANRDHVIVGGQYAEPPARYLPRFPTSAEIFGDENEEHVSSTNAFVESEALLSGTTSPYVNYKNTNMAFSPQNLNDAFSIVDK